VYIKISAQNKGEAYSDSCRDLVNYLEKENKNEIEESQERFFCSSQDDVPAEEVIEAIDGNVKGKGLKNKDAKFYNIIVAPSSSELRTIGDDKEKLKDFVRELMQDYADRMNRTNKDGKKVTVDDLVWYGKVEKKRTFSDKDKIILHNEKYAALTRCLRDETDIKTVSMLREQLDEMKGVYILNSKDRIEQTAMLGKGDIIIERGMARPEEYQSHVHVIVSRMHRDERMSLSPMANNKGGKNILNGEEVDIGFDRMAFAKEAEVRYDLKFDHQRAWSETLETKRNIKKEGESLKYYSEKLCERVVADFTKHNKLKDMGANQFANYIYLSSNEQDETYNIRARLDEYVNKYYPPEVLKMLDRKYEEIKQLKILDNIANMNLPVAAIKKASEIVTKTISRSMYI